MQPRLKIKTNERTITDNGVSEIKLKALENDIRFYIETQNVHFDSLNYQLLGYDQKPLSTKYPEIRYTNIQGGNYLLNIKIYSLGKVSSVLTTKLFIEKELTEEWWFVPTLAFYALLLISAGIYFLMLNNFRQKVKVHAIREKIASDLHDEVGATLSSIAISTKLIQKKIGNKNQEIKPILDQISEDSEQTIYNLRDKVWAINPMNDDTDVLFEKIRSFALQILIAKGVEFEYKNDIENLHKIKTSMEQRQNVYLILKEAINNIAKHANATIVSLQLSMQSKQIRVLLTDNGVGFEMDKESEGNGIRNFHKRAKDGFLDFNIKSIINKGTIIEIIIPNL